MKNTFTSVVEGYRDGSLLGELNDVYRSVVGAVQETGRVGEISLALKIYPPGRSGAVTVEATVRNKQPSFPPEKQSYFIGEDGGLQLLHPKQTGLFDAGEENNKVAQIGGKA